MKVWIGHLVSPIRPTLCPHPSLSGQQTNTATSPTLLQHYNRRHLYNWLFEQQYNVLRILRRARCIIPGDSIATFGVSEEAKPGPLAPPQNGKLTTPLIHRVNLANNFFYHLSNSPGSSPVLQLLTKVVVFLLLFGGIPSYHPMQWIGENWTNISR